MRMRIKLDHSSGDNPWPSDKTVNGFFCESHEAAEAARDDGCESGSMRWRSLISTTAKNDAEVTIDDADAGKTTIAAGGR